MRADQVNNVPTLSLRAYQSQACQANQFKGQVDAINQLRFGLFGEIGGLLAVVKKEARDLAPAQHHTVTEELGDALWYATTVAVQYGSNLQDIGVAAILELQERFQVKREISSSDITFEEVDGLLAFCSAEVGKLELKKELRRLGGHVGQLLQLEATPDLADSPPSELLANIFADMAITAALFHQKMCAIAHANLTKIESRWPQEGARHLPFFDEGLGVLEKFPRKIEMRFIEQHKKDGTPYVIQQWNGVNIGDRLTDNRLEPDGYRFHDVFHLAYVVHLGWSPVTRALLKLKRKSDAALDENEDGARATIIEEGIATWIFNHASSHKYFVDGRLEYGMLKQVRAMVAGYEVAACPIWQWERAILSGYEVFRSLFENGGGVVVADLEERTLTFEARALKLDDPIPAPPTRPKLIGAVMPPSDHTLQ